MLKKEIIDHPNAEIVSEEIEYCLNLCEQERKNAKSQIEIENRKRYL